MRFVVVERGFRPLFVLLIRLRLRAALPIFWSCQWPIAAPLLFSPPGAKRRQNAFLNPLGQPGRCTPERILPARCASGAGSLIGTCRALFFKASGRRE